MHSRKGFVNVILMQMIFDPARKACEGCVSPWTCARSSKQSAVLVAGNRATLLLSLPCRQSGCILSCNAAGDEALGDVAAGEVEVAE